MAFKSQTSLKELQTQFIKAIDNPNAPVPWIAFAPNLSPVEQISVYHQSMVGNLTQVLKATYSVCLALVGEDFFNYLSKSYITQNPYHLPDLTFYGKNFPLFLKKSENLHHLPYLSQVADLEWACLLALEGPSPLSLDLTGLSKVSEEQQPLLCFKLPPNSTLFDFKDPIVKIWEVNQPGVEDKCVDLNSDKGGYYLVYRKNWDLCITRLTNEEHTLLTFISQGLIFEKVCSLTQLHHPHIDIPSIFTRLVERGWLVEFYLANSFTQS